MRKLFEHWKSCFFTELLLVVLLFIALCVALRNRRRYEVLKYFPLYIISLIILYLSIYISLLSPNLLSYITTTFNFINYLDYISILVELFVFTHFFRLVIVSKRMKMTLVLLILFFIPYFLFELYNDRYFPRSISETIQSRVYTVEAVLLLIPCVFYFYELFKRPAVLNLKNEPSFWVVTGWSFFAMCTLPYSLLENYLRNIQSTLMTQLYSVFYIFYILLFIMIIRAYSCKKKYI